MSNDPWTGARLGTNSDAPLGGSYLAEVVNELGKWGTPGFATTADRDSALAAWVANGNTADDGMTCTVTSIGLQRLVTGSWSNDIVAAPTVTPLSVISPYTISSTPWRPARTLRNGKHMRLSGSVTNSVAPFTAANNTKFQFGSLPTGTAPSDVEAFIVPFGDGVSTTGGGIIEVHPDATLWWIAPKDISIGAIHALSLGVAGQWEIGQ